MDAFFSGTYEKIEGVSDAEIDEKTGELIQRPPREQEQEDKEEEDKEEEERMTIEDDSASEYNTGEDDPDFVEIDSDEMERLIMNPARRTGEGASGETDCRFDRKHAAAGKFTSWKWRSQTFGEAGA